MRYWVPSRVMDTLRYVLNTHILFLPHNFVVSVKNVVFKVFFAFLLGKFVDAAACIYSFLRFAHRSSHQAKGKSCVS
jgi:hypothetical protein